MPRPRQPSHIAEAIQLHKGNAQRKRGADPLNENPLPPPPDWFNDIHREHWLYLLGIAAPGLLRASDHATMPFALCVQRTGRLVATRSAPAPATSRDCALLAAP